MVVIALSGQWWVQNGLSNENLFLSVPIVQKTVGKYAKHIAYYSETEDPSIPTEDIGVPNTERGTWEEPGLIL